jgi:aminocarboxymuconate-semialdehyde decarboxylase
VTSGSGTTCHTALRIKVNKTLDKSCRHLKEIKQQRDGAAKTRANALPEESHMTMRIDAYTHFIPNRFYKEVMSAGDHKDIGKRMMGVPSIYDVNIRKKVVDKFKDYAQILSYPMPPFELMTKSPAQAEEYAKIVNDGFAELCAKESDHFPGWVAQAPMFAPDVGVREAARAMKMGALGVQIYTNVAGKPLDHPDFTPFWKAMNKTETPIWLHP